MALRSIRRYSLQLIKAPGIDSKNYLLERIYILRERIFFCGTPNNIAKIFKSNFII